MLDLPFSFDKPADSPGFMLWQTTITWQRAIKEALDPYDISHSQFVIMALLLWFEKHAYSPTQILIANWSKLDKMTVSKAINKLVSKELVNQSEHKGDTRAKSVILTKNGIKLIHKLIPLIERLDDQFFNKLSNSERDALIRSFKKITFNNTNEIKKLQK